MTQKKEVLKMKKSKSSATSQKKLKVVNPLQESSKTPDSKQMDVEEVSATEKLNFKQRRLINKKIIEKALKAKKAALKTRVVTKAKKIRTKPTFRRPHTLRIPKNPKYPRHVDPVVPKTDVFSIIKYPLTTELCMKKLEDSNTLTFIVNSKASKKAIKKAIKQRYDVLCTKVTTLNLPTGEKKAYVKLNPEVDAIEVANRIGMV